MKKYITLLISLVLIMSALIGCVDVDNSDDYSDPQNNTITERNNTGEDNLSNEIDEPVVEKEEIIYEDNECIQNFITIYNRLYSDTPITSDMLTKYHHHGKDHDDQVKFNVDGYTILLSDTSGFSSDGYKASIYIDNIGENNDGIKSLFFKFMRVYDNTLTDTTLEDYWVQQTESGSNMDDFGEIECYTTTSLSNNLVEFTKIDGEFLDK